MKNLPTCPISVPDLFPFQLPGLSPEPLRCLKILRNHTGSALGLRLIQTLPISTSAIQCNHFFKVFLICTALNRFWNKKQNKTKQKHNTVYWQRMFSVSFIINKPHPLVHYHWQWWFTVSSDRWMEGLKGFLLGDSAATRLTQRG